MEPPHPFQQSMMGLSCRRRHRDFSHRPLATGNNLGYRGRGTIAVTDSDPVYDPPNWPLHWGNQHVMCVRRPYKHLPAEAAKGK